MAAKIRSYPRATVKKIVKGHSQKNMGKSVDALIYLEYVMFIDEYDKPTKHIFSF